MYSLFVIIQIFCISFKLNHVEAAESFSVQPVCSDPSLGKHAKEQSRFAIIGKPVNSLGGMGNELIFFPAVYFYAALTGRDIIVHHQGILGELCSVLVCGFPKLDEMSLAFPKYLSSDHLKNGRDLKAMDMVREFKGEIEVKEDIIYGLGYVWKSNWWLWMNGTTECIQKLTGCDYGDYICAQYYAYQALIRGPFDPYLTRLHEHRITGIPSHVLHGILSLKHPFAPRIDLAVHLRTQFLHFERLSHVSTVSYKNEVSEWLNSSQRFEIFNTLENRIREELTHLGLYNNNNNNSSSSSVENNPSYIYIAADNEEVKDALIAQLEQSSHQIQIMRIETSGIVHTKNIENMKNMTAGNGSFDMIFDWYALSLSKVVLAWRRDSSLRSTFIQSAASVGYNSLALALVPKHGRMVWNPL